MRRTKDENRRRKQGAYVDFVPDGDPVGVGGLSSAHARMGSSLVAAMHSVNSKTASLAKKGGLLTVLTGS